LKWSFFSPLLLPCSSQFFPSENVLSIHYEVGGETEHPTP
jgi:hypothetical protein